MINLVKNATDDELFGLFEAMGKVKLDKNTYQQMLDALHNQDLKTVADLIAGKSFRAAHGSTMLNFTRVVYSLSSTDDLVQANLVYGIQIGGLGDYFSDIDDVFKPTITPERARTNG